MLKVINTRLGVNRGVPRVWLEGQKLNNSFVPGQKLDVHLDPKKKIVKLKVSESGRFSVSRRTRNGRVVPLIEIKDDELSELFGDIGVLLRVVVKNGTATIEVHAIDSKATERLLRFKNKVESGKALTIGSLFSGGGILDGALHEGLKSSGLNCYTKFIVEQERKYLDAMVLNQPHLFRDDSILIESSIEYVELRKPPKVDVVIAGLPCTGASLAGATKNKLKAAEFHKDAGACFFYTLQFIAQCQPSLIILENVPLYEKTASMAVIKSVLETWGYDLQTANFNGNFFGCLENRDRMCVVATTKGMPEFKLRSIKPIAIKPDSVSEILEDIPLDAECWRDYQYLIDKQKRDEANGKGFKRVLIDGTEGHVPTMRRLYHKAGSTDAYVLHPDGIRSRLFTAKEHARLKDVPIALINGLSNSVAHEVLGQSVCYPVFTALGNALGAWAKDAAIWDKVAANDDYALKVA